MSKIDSNQKYFTKELGDGLPEDHIVFTILMLVKEFFEINPELKSKINKYGRTREYYNENMLGFIIFCYVRKIRSCRDMATHYSDNNEAMKILLKTTTVSKTIICDFINNWSDLINGFFYFLVKKGQDLNLIKGDVISIDGSFMKAKASNSNRISRNNIKKVIKTLKRLDFNNKKNKIQKDLQDYFDEDSTRKTPKYILNLTKKLNKNALKFLKEGIQDNDSRNTVIARLEYMHSLHTSKSNYDINCGDWEAVFLPDKHGYRSYNFNIQFATDIFKHMIVAVGLSNHSNDSNELINMIEASIFSLGRKPYFFVADYGYYLKKALFYCFLNGIKVIMPDSEESKKINSQHNSKKYKTIILWYDYLKKAYRCEKGAILNLIDITKSKKYIYRIYKSVKCDRCKEIVKCKVNKNKVLRVGMDFIKDYFLSLYFSDLGQKIYKKRGPVSEGNFARLKELYNSKAFQRLGAENCLVILYLEAIAINIRIIHDELSKNDEEANGKNKENNENDENFVQTTLI